MTGRPMTPLGLDSEKGPHRVPVLRHGPKVLLGHRFEFDAERFGIGLEFVRAAALAEPVARGAS